MKKSILVLLSPLLLLSSQSNARVLSIEVDAQNSTAERTIYVSTIEMCPNTFQSLTPRVTKVSEDTAHVVLHPALPIRCEGRVRQARFVVLIDDELKDLGLDPKTAHVFFELE